MFMPNRFDWGGLAAADKKANPWNYADDIDTTKQYMNSTNAFGISKADNPFSKGNLAGGIGAMANTGIGKGIVGAIGGIGNRLAYNTISGGLSSGAGAAVGNLTNTVGGAVAQVNPLLGAGIQVVGGAVGGGINALVGTATDQAKKAANDEGTAALNNYVSNATTLDDVESTPTVANVQDAHRGGVFKKGWAREHNEADREARANALAWADRSREGNINNILADQLDDQLANYSAFGGPLTLNDGALGLMQYDKYIDALNNRSKAVSKNGTLSNGFDSGGMLKASLFDDFGSDPIGAVMRYNKGLENMAAAQEAQEAEAAREASLADMQNRIAGLETQNQGLHAMMAAMPSASVAYGMGEAIPTTAPDVPTATNGSLKDFIKAHEGFRSNAYWLAGEPAPTIGYGFHINYPGTDRKVQMGDKITREEADQYLDAALEGISNDLSKKVPNWDKLTSYQRDALIDLAYGTGTGGAHFKKNSRLMTALRDEDWEEASKQLISRSKSLPKYDKYLLEISKRRQNMFRNGEYDMKAFGGELGTNGTDWTSGLLHVDAGGSHEDNALGGVPMGVDEQGIPNLVEEGETVFNNYVFSQRLKVPEDMYKDLGLGGKITKGITFAEASKELAKESEQRPNDPISKAGLEASLAKLAEVQEAERMVEEMQKTTEENSFAYGGDKGNVFAGNGDESNELPRRGVSGEFLGDWSAETSRPRDYVSPLGLLDPNLWLTTYRDAAEVERLVRQEGLSYDDATALVEARNANTQTGMAPTAGRTGGYRIPPVRQNTRAFQQSRQAARPVGNTRMPQAQTPQRPATTASRDYTGEANAVADARNLRTGESWAANGNRQSTVSTERVVEGENVGGGRFTGRATTTRRVNPRPTGEHVAGRGSAAEYDAVYDNLAGTLGVRNPYAGIVWPWAVGAGAAGLGAGLFLYDDAQRQANLERMNASLSLSPDSTTVINQTPVGQGTVLAPTGTERQGTSASQPPREAMPSAGETGSTPVTAGNTAATPAVPPSVGGNTGSGARGTTGGSRAGRRASAARSNRSETLDLRPLEGVSVFNPAMNTGSLTGLDGISTADLGWEAARREAANRENGRTRGHRDDGTYATWMRYAPAIGAGVFTLTDALGLTNRPDYTYANRLEAAANRAGIAPNISYNPIGNYLTYTPMDIWAEQNRMDANSRAAARNIMNLSGGNRGTAMAGQIANSYASQLAAGQLFRNALEYNDARREKVEDFNRRTNMFNRQMGLEADMANARYAQQASQLGLSGLAQAAALRDSIDQRIGAARAANINNLLTSLGNIGRENFAMNQINDDDAWNYGVRRNGRTPYKRKNSNS